MQPPQPQPVVSAQEARPPLITPHTLHQYSSNNSSNSEQLGTLHGGSGSVPDARHETDGDAFSVAQEIGLQLSEVFYSGEPCHRVQAQRSFSLSKVRYMCVYIYIQYTHVHMHAHIRTHMQRDTANLAQSSHQILVSLFPSTSEKPLKQKQQTAVT